MIKAEHVAGEANHFRLNAAGQKAIADHRILAAEGGERTSAKPRTEAGLEWTCWRTGIQRYEWRAVRADGVMLKARQNHGKSTFSASVNGEAIRGKGANAANPKRFQALVFAMRAAVAGK